MTDPRTLELFLKFKLEATHSLEEREQPHAHVWRIEVGLTGPVEQGRIVSMPVLREVLSPAVQKLQGSFLNANRVLDEGSRAYPTCECLAFHFEKAFGEELRSARLRVKLTQIQVSVDEIDGEETGSVRLSLP